MMTTQDPPCPACGGHTHTVRQGGRTYRECTHGCGWRSDGPALTVICEVCGETLQEGSSGQTETVVCGRCHDARERRVQGVQERIRRVGAERYVAARMPYVVGRIMEEVGRG